MKKKTIVSLLLSVAGLPLLATAQSALNYTITDAGSGDTTISWSFTGEIASPAGAMLAAPGIVGLNPLSFPVQLAPSFSGIQSFSFSGMSVSDVTSNSTVAVNGFSLGRFVYQTGPSSYMTNTVADFTLTPAVAGDMGNTTDPAGGGILAVKNGDYVSVSSTQNSLTIPIPYSDFIPTNSSITMPIWGDGGTVSVNYGGSEPTPEPGTLALAALGFAGLGALRKKS
jgi:hypothetical protein